MSDNIDSLGYEIQTSPPTKDRRGQWTVDAKKRGFREIQWWRQKKADLIRECESILDKAQVESRDLTAGEKTWYQNSLEDAKFAASHVDRCSAIEQANLSRHAEGAGSQWSPGQNFESHRARLEQMQQKPGAQGRRYGDLFPNAGDSGGFTSGEEWLRTVASGMSDSRILQMNAATHLEGVGSSGGFVVPGVLSQRWLDASLENEIVRPRCQVVPMTTENLKVAGFDVGDMSTSSPFGFKPEWAAENSDATPQVGKFRMIELHSNKLRLFSEASNELVQDGNDFESQVGQAMIAAIGWGLDDACLGSGNGAGMPRSILNDAALITVAKESGQANGTIVYENVLKMFARLHPSAMKNAVWVANSTTLPQLLTMSVGIGAAGALMPAVKESNGTFSLLGMELLFTEKLPVLGQKGDILLVNFSNYVLGLRKDVMLEKANTPGWTRDVMSYRVILRADGQGKWNRSQQPKNGDSRSWCVALAAR